MSSTRIALDNVKYMSVQSNGEYADRTFTIEFTETGTSVLVELTREQMKDLYQKVLNFQPGMPGYQGM